MVQGVRSLKPRRRFRYRGCNGSAGDPSDQSPIFYFREWKREKSHAQRRYLLRKSLQTGRQNPKEDIYPDPKQEKRANKLLEVSSAAVRKPW